MRVLVGCESSGRVRDAFLALGHDAMSADTKPTAAPGPHYRGDVRDIWGDGFDLIVLHPPCTYLANVSGPRLFQDPSRIEHVEAGAAFFRECLAAPAPRVAVENPQMLKVAMRLVGERPTQWVHPWEHGDAWMKRTGLWLRGLPRLVPTQVVTPQGSWVSTTRHWSTRSRTFAGIAAAMASQWGTDVHEYAEARLF